MKAMRLTRIVPLADDPAPLQPADLPAPEPGEGEVRLRVAACGVCHTELDEIEGRTPPPHLPVIPGHQIIGVIDAVGTGVDAAWRDRRVGVAWIASACGGCAQCRAGNENLCPEFLATGRDVDGGYAEAAIARADFVHPLPDGLSNIEAAPMLCAGAIGYRAVKLSDLRDGQVLALTGFGASNHLVLRLVRFLYPTTPVFVFARSAAQREFALELGATWAGDTEDAPPALIDRVIDTTPAWRPPMATLRWLAPGGRLVMNVIRKEYGDRAVLAEMDYARDLWMEKVIRSVANVTRADVRGFLNLAVEAGIRPEVQTYPLSHANHALLELHHGRSRGSKVLVIGA